MSPDRQALLSLYHDDATAVLDRALQAQHEPEGLHVVHAALVEALADAHTNGRPLDVSTTVPDETIAAIEARLTAASDAYYEQLAPRCSYRSAGDGMACGLMSGHDGPHTMLIPPSNGWGLVADTTKDLRALLSEVRRLTDATQHLTDLVRHARGPLHEDGLLTDAEYAALAEDSGAVARLTTIAQLQGDVARETRAKNVAIGERDEAQAALATARVEGQQAERARVAAFLGKQAEQAATKGQEVGADAFAWAADRVREGRYLPVEIVAREARGLNGDAVREWPPEVFASWYGSVTTAIAEASQAIATARLDGARAMLREVEARAEGVAERHEGLAKAARAKDDRNRATAKQAAAEAVFGAIREIRAIDPAAVVGSGS